MFAEHCIEGTVDQHVGRRVHYKEKMAAMEKKHAKIKLAGRKGDKGDK